MGLQLDSSASAGSTSLQQVLGKLVRPDAPTARALKQIEQFLCNAFVVLVFGFWMMNVE